MLVPAAPSLGEAPADVRRAREPVGSRQARRGRQEPPCFEGSETVSRLRPFLRRRERTARPHRVAMRVRKPCLLIRRLLRGRYDGFMRASLQSEPGKLVTGAGAVKLPEEDGEEGEDGEDGEVRGRTSFNLSHLSVLSLLSVLVFRHHSAPIATATIHLRVRRIPVCQEQFRSRCCPVDFSTAVP